MQAYLKYHVWGVLYFAGADAIAQTRSLGVYGVGAGGTSGCVASAGSLRVVWVGGAGDDSASGVWGGVVNGWSGVDSVRRHIGKSDNSNVLIVPTLCVGM